MPDLKPSSFNRTTTAEEVCTVFASSIKGKRIILTGPTISGVGFATAEAIVKFDPALLVLAGRSISKLEEGKAKLLESQPEANVTLLELNLGSFESVRKAAEEVKGWGKPIDILINNAAVMDCPFEKTVDGHELQLQTNHLGHALFTSLILDSILASSSKRIVQVSSMGHAFGDVRWDDPDFAQPDSFTPGLGYGQSKAGMILYGRCLAKKYNEQGLKVYSLHPGGISTPLQKHWTEDYKKMIGEKYGAYNPDGSPNMDIWKTLEQGASTTCRAAFDPDLEPNGAYLDDCQVAEQNCSDFSKDPVNVDRIWHWTAKLLGGEAHD